MRVFNIRNIIFSLFVLGFAAQGCQKTETAQVKLNNVTYQLDTLNLYTSAAQKTRQKTPEQFISILYTNLYQKSIPGNTLNDLSVLSSSVGDQQLCRQMYVQSFISAPGVVIPKDADMRADIDKFISNTYVLFYLRKPGEIERYQLKTMIQKDAGLSVQDIYTAFALSNEYLYY